MTVYQQGATIQKSWWWLCPQKRSVPKIQRFPKENFNFGIVSFWANHLAIKKIASKKGTFTIICLEGAW